MRVESDNGEIHFSARPACARIALPVMDEVLTEGKQRGIEVITAPTSEVCQLLEEVKKGQAHAILHCTC